MEAKGRKLELPRLVKHKLVQVKLVSWRKLSSYHSPLGPSCLWLGPTKEEGKASQAKLRRVKL